MNTKPKAAKSQRQALQQGKWNIPGIDCDLYDTLYGIISGIASMGAAIAVVTASATWTTNINSNTSATMDSVSLSPHIKSPTSCVSTSSSTDNGNNTNCPGEISMIPVMTLEEAQVGTHVQLQQKRGEKSQKQHLQQQMMGQISASVNDIYCGTTFHGARRAYVGIEARRVGKQYISPFHLRVSAMSGGLTDPFLNRSGRLGYPVMNDLDVGSNGLHYDSLPGDNLFAARSGVGSATGGHGGVLTGSGVGVGVARVPLSTGVGLGAIKEFNVADEQENWNTKECWNKKEGMFFVCFFCFGVLTTLFCFACDRLFEYLNMLANRIQLFHLH